MAIEHFAGSCHCGAVTYEVDLDLAEGTMKCNCSLCTKIRAWIVIVKPDAFKLTAGAGQQTEYTWTPPGRTEPILHYLFCRRCGVRTPGWGNHPSMGGSWWFVPVTSLDDLSSEKLSAAPIRYVDGRHDQFDQRASAPFLS